MPQRTFRIGTRGSVLALAQAREVKRRLESKYPAARFQLIVIKTTGDEFQSVELFKKTNTGVFTKKIEEKLIKKEIDVAVHSLKDLPTRLPGGLRLAAFPKRADTRDAVISRNRLALKELPKAARVGTGSPRRKRQILLARPDLELLDIRGNLDTRIAKVLKKECDAVIVARAGLLRLKKYLKYARPISAEEVLPAVGQAALALEIRTGDKAMFQMARALNHPDTEKKVLAERNFLKVLQGGCRVPVGIHSAIRKGRLFLKAAVFSTQTPDFVAGELSGPAARGEMIARKLARQLLKKGARGFLRQARRNSP